VDDASDWHKEREGRPNPKCINTARVVGFDDLTDLALLRVDVRTTLPAAPWGSPAACAGLREGDQVVAIEGERIDNSRALVRSIAVVQPGRTVRPSGVRNGQQKFPCS
jgi:S1-C subfamily serine protease